MYVNKCTKCGKEFETKNPKRVICPECLYAERSVELSSETKTENGEQKQSFYSSYNYDSQPERQDRYQRNFSSGSYGNGYSNRNNNYGDRRPQQGRFNNQQGGYRNNNYGDRRPQQNRYGNQQGNYQNRSYGDRRPQQNRYNNQQNRFNKRPNNFNHQRPRMQQRQQQKALLVTKEQLEQIELLYKQMLPLPNPDAHEVIGQKLEIEPRKVFFGINLIRQKMMLPKLPFPKRKLAISPDQMFAIQNLYEPLLPVPPIGCHKIIAAQLKMDEWRVHVGIGLIRAKLGLERWNPNRPDAPDEFKVQVETADSDEKNKTSVETEEKPKKVSRKKKTVTEESEEPVKEKKKTRKKKVEE